MNFIQQHSIQKKKLKKKNKFSNQISIEESTVPSHRLIYNGTSSLSDTELLSIIIGSYSVDKGVSVANDVMEASNYSMNNLAKKSYHELEKIKGIGHYKASQIIALIELSKRFNINNTDNKINVKNSESVYNAIRSYYIGSVTEQFYAIYLNRANNIIKIKQISSGAITGTLADIRIILKEALDCYATALIVSHNHPSGNINPSENDIKLTEKIKNACMIFDITLLDHIIACENNYYSFADYDIL